MESNAAAYTARLTSLVVAIFSFLTQCVLAGTVKYTCGYFFVNFYAE